METNNNTTLTLDPWFVTGFCDGEAAFTFSKAKNGNPTPYFSVKLTASDGTLLNKLKNYFGVGKVYACKPRAPTTNSGWTKAAVYYRVANKSGYKVIIKHFDTYPLQGKKAQQYDIWKRMVEHKASCNRKPDLTVLQKLTTELSSLATAKQPWIDVVPLTTM